LAYHFVIGNGTSTGNGQIEVGDRWRRQINGGHVHSDYLNNISLGICLVGDFNRDQPTRAQLESCEELIRYLRERCGKIDRRDIPVRPHREMNPPRWPTDCPGDVFPYSWFRRFQEAVDVLEWAAPRGRTAAGRVARCRGRRVACR